jgi:hypothetical protein
MPTLSRKRIFVLGDQAASSLSNVVVVVLVANGSSKGTFGAFALGMVAYQLVTSGIRSVAGEPLLSLYAHQGPSARRRIVGDIHGTALFLSVVSSLVLALISLVVGGQPGATLLALSVVLPLLVLQDTWRYLFIIDRPGAALTIDLLWLLAVGIGLSLVPAGTQVGAYVWIWGLSGAATGLLGTILGFGIPRWPHPWRWLVRHRAVCWRYFTEFVTAQGMGHVIYTALAAISGAAALGAARAAWTVFGFLGVLHAGLYMLLVPEGARHKDNPRRLQQIFVVASAATTALAVVWTVFVLVVPDDIGANLFNETWLEARHLLLPMGLATIAGGLQSGGLLGLRALADARRSLRARLTSAPFLVLCPLTGAFVNGAMGFVIGQIIGNSVAAVIWWTMFRKAAKDPREALVDIEIPDDETLAVEMSA